MFFLKGQIPIFSCNHAHQIKATKKKEKEKTMKRELRKAKVSNSGYLWEGQGRRGGKKGSSIACQRTQQEPPFPLYEKVGLQRGCGWLLSLLWHPILCTSKVKVKKQKLD